MRELPRSYLCTTVLSTVAGLEIPSFTLDFRAVTPSDDDKGKVRRGLTVQTLEIGYDMKPYPSERKESMDWDTLTFAIRFLPSLEPMVLRENAKPVDAEKEMVALMGQENALLKSQKK